MASLYMSSRRLLVKVCGLIVNEIFKLSESFSYCHLIGLQLRILFYFFQVIMKLMEMIDPKSDFFSMLIKKLAPPLVTLLATEPEIQYVSLRNINFIVQKRFVLYLTSLPYCKL